MQGSSFSKSRDGVLCVRAASSSAFCPGFEYFPPPTPVGELAFLHIQPRRVRFLHLGAPTADALVFEEGRTRGRPADAVLQQRELQQFL